MAEEPRICTQCGHAQTTGAFCELCGTRLPEIVAAPVPAPASAPAAAPPAAEPPYVAPVAPIPAVAPTPPVPPSPPAAPVAGAYPAYPPAPSAFMDYLTFRRLLAPGLLQAIFWAFEGMNLFYWIKTIYYAQHSALEVVFSIFGLLFTALLIRVLTEVAIAFFQDPQGVAKSR